MFEPIKLHIDNGNIIYGLADNRKISTDKICSLSDSWKNPGGILCKAGSSTVAYTVDNMFVKCSPSRYFNRALSRLFRISRPMRSLKMAKLLSKYHISTPEVFCAVREKRFILPICDYLVTENLNTDSVVFGNKCNEAQLNRLFSLGCALLKKMHDANICHGDASLRNFYLFTDEKKSAGIGVIDLDGCRTVPFLTKKRLFIKEDARFISSYILTSKASESEKIIYKICSDFIEQRGVDPTENRKYLGQLAKHTFCYLKKTRR